MTEKDEELLQKARDMKRYAYVPYSHYWVGAALRAEDGRVFTGRGSDNDIVVSSTKAYVNALNRLLASERVTKTPLEAE